MNLTTEQLAKAKEAKTIEELTALAKAEGMEAPAEEIEKFWNTLHAEGEISDEELDNVSGGCGEVMYDGDPDHVLVNNAHCCPHCGKPMEYLPGREPPIIHVPQTDGTEKLYHADYYQCQNCANRRIYVHTWEEDRWFIETHLF